MGAALDLLVDELIEARRSRSLTQEEWAKAIKFSPTHVSSVETRHRPPTDDYVAAVDKAFHTGGAYSRLLVKLSRFDADPVWLRDWVEHERKAKLLRWFEPLYVPGLLQTEAYARAVFSDPRISPETAEKFLKSRLERQEVLLRDRPAKFVFVIDEMVLRRPAVRGRPEIMAEQLDHLLQCAERPNIFLHVVPLEAGIYSGLQGTLILATLDGGTVVAEVDHQVRAQPVTGADDLEMLQGVWEAIRAEALPQAQSIELIREVAKEWTI